ncbi:DnaJ-domain-containing protein, partial [Mycena floridula]
ISTSSAMASSSASGSKSIDDREIERLLSREASAFQREVEVERILSKSFKLNPYDILDIPDGAGPEEVKKKFRQLSLFIHPDKCSHERAPEAFDLLKKAESELSTPEKREEIDATIKQSRIGLLKSLGLPPTTLDGSPELREALQPLGGVSQWKIMMRAKVKEMLIDEEVRRRRAIKLNLANEGLEARKKDEEVMGKKRKQEEDKVWEEHREQRVDSWRSFATSGSKKKKKNKVALLG